MIVCDTGPLVAAALSNDSDHEACVELFTALHTARRDLLVPATVAAALRQPAFAQLRPRVRVHTVSLGIGPIMAYEAAEQPT